MENNASSDNISGFKEPVKPKKKFAGCDVFDVPPETFSKFKNGKKPYARWNTYMNLEDGYLSGIKTYTQKNHNKSIILQDSNSGAMLYLRRK